MAAQRTCVKNVMKAVSIAPKEVPTIAVFVNLVCFIWKDNVFLNVPRDIIFKTGGVKPATSLVGHVLAQRWETV